MTASQLNEITIIVLSLAFSAAIVYYIRLHGMNHPQPRDRQGRYSKQPVTFYGDLHK